MYGQNLCCIALQCIAEMFWSVYIVCFAVHHCYQVSLGNARSESLLYCATVGIDKSFLNAVTEQHFHITQATGVAFLLLDSSASTCRPFQLPLFQMHTDVGYSSVAVRTPQVNPYARFISDTNAACRLPPLRAQLRRKLAQRL